MFEILVYPDIPTAFVLDLAVLTICILLLLRYGRLAHSHPAIIYLIFHILVVPSRLLAVWNGAPALFSDWQLFETVGEEELTRAAFLADLTLIIMTLAWIRASVADLKEKGRKANGVDEQPVTLSLRHIWRVVVIAFPIGITAILLLGHVPGFEKPDIDLGEWQESSWVTITMSWAGLALLALIYWYGFRWWLIAPMTVHLFLMAVQGYHRFRAVIPLLLLIQIYLDRRGKRWPPAPIIATVVVGILIFFPLKTIGRMEQEGANLAEITRSSSEIVRAAISGQAADQSVLDQLASSLTLIDRADKFYYGSTYLALLTSPIPRQWWPDKPGLADYQTEFSTPARPMRELGMIMTFIGEFYLNFGYPGIVLLSFLTAYWLARTYFRAYRSGYYSVLRFTYLLITCNLLLVYRDGFMSLFVFTLVNMMPLSIIVILHYVLPMRQNTENVPLLSMAASQK